MWCQIMKIWYITSTKTNVSLIRESKLLKQPWANKGGGVVGANLVPISVRAVSLFSEPTNKFKIVMFSIEFCLFQKRLSRDSLLNVSFRERKLSP